MEKVWELDRASFQIKSEILDAFILTGVDGISFTSFLHIFVLLSVLSRLESFVNHFVLLDTKWLNLCFSLSLSRCSSKCPYRGSVSLGRLTYMGWLLALCRLLHMKFSFLVSSLITYIVDEWQTFWCCTFECIQGGNMRWHYRIFIMGSSDPFVVMAVVKIVTVCSVRS